MKNLLDIDVDETLNARGGKCDMMLGNPEMQTSLGGYFGRRQITRENGLDGVHWMCVCVWIKTKDPW